MIFSKLRETAIRSSGSNIPGSMFGAHESTYQIDLNCAFKGFHVHFFDAGESPGDARVIDEDCQRTKRCLGKCDRSFNVRFDPGHRSLNHYGDWSSADAHATLQKYAGGNLSN